MPQWLFLLTLLGISVVQTVHSGSALPPTEYKAVAKVVQPADF